MVAWIIVFALLFQPFVTQAQSTTLFPPTPNTPVETTYQEPDLKTREGQAQYWLEHQAEIIDQLKNFYGEVLEFGAKKERSLGEAEYLETFSGRPSQVTEAAIEFFREEWGDEEYERLQSSQNAEEFKEKAISTLGHREFLRILEQNPKLLSQTKPGVGIAEFNVLENNIFVRIVHQKTQIDFSMIDRFFFPVESKHLEQYITRRHVDAGRSRTDGQKGRDSIIVYLDDNHVYGIQEHPRPQVEAYIPQYVEANPLDPANHIREIVKNVPGAVTHLAKYIPNTLARMRDYYVATWKPTSLSLVAGGAVFATAQAGITYGMTWMKDPTHMVEAAEVSFAFGMAIAAFNSVYRNWQERGRPNWLEKKDGADYKYDGLMNFFNVKSEGSGLNLIKSFDWNARDILTSKPARQGLISMAYSNMLMYVIHGHTQTITVSDPTGWLYSVLFTGTSMFVSNIGSTWWREASFMRSEMRLNKDSVINVKIGDRRVKSKLTWATIDQQSLYLVPFIFKLPPLIFKTAEAAQGIPIVGDVAAAIVPWIPPLVSILFGRWYTVLKAENLGADPKTGDVIRFSNEKTDADKMRRDFEDTWYVKRGIRPLQKALSSGANFCSSMLSGRSK